MPRLTMTKFLTRLAQHDDICFEDVRNIYLTNASDAPEKAIVNGIMRSEEMPTDPTELHETLLKDISRSDVFCTESHFKEDVSKELMKTSHDYTQGDFEGQTICNASLLNLFYPPDVVSFPLVLAARYGFIYINDKEEYCGISFHFAYNETEEKTYWLLGHARNVAGTRFYDVAEVEPKDPQKFSFFYEAAGNSPKKIECMKGVINEGTVYEIIIKLIEFTKRYNHTISYDDYYHATKDLNSIMENTLNNTSHAHMVQIRTIEDSGLRKYRLPRVLTDVIQFISKSFAEHRPSRGAPASQQTRSQGRSIITAQPRQAQTSPKPNPAKSEEKSSSPGCCCRLFATQTKEEKRPLLDGPVQGYGSVQEYSSTTV